MNEDQERRYKAIKRTLRKIGLKTNASFGRLGEEFANVKNGKQRIRSLTKTAKYRIPDILSDAYLIRS